EEWLANVLAAVERLEPAVGFRFALGIDRELAGRGIEADIEVHRAPPKVISEGAEVRIERDGFVPERRLRQDLHEAFLVQLLHRRVYPRPRDLRQGGDLACRRGAEIEERQVHPGLVFR